jgi:uncharacterized membrane protein YbhN (UPF0104 family)
MVQVVAGNSQPLAFLGGFGDFFAHLTDIHLVPLVIGWACFAVYITARTRAWYAALHAAYPDARIRWRELWGSYWATYAVNNVIPFRGGEAIRLVLGRSAVPGSTYPTIAASFLVEHVFDASFAVITLTFAFTQGVFPKPPDFANLNAVDLSYFAGHPQFGLFVLTCIGVGLLVGYGIASRRVAALWERVKRGWTILFDRRRYFREVWLVQAGGALFRIAAFWCFLDAFGIGGSLRNALLVIAASTIATALPLTPGGAGVQQALLLKIFAGHASATVAAYAVGQEVAIALLAAGIGFVALFFVFRFRSFGELLRYARATHRAEAHVATQAPV